MYANQLKTIIFDYFLIEGVISYFRVCIVLFDYMEKRLLKLKTITHFLSSINEFMDKLSDFSKFKKDLDKVFINKDLINIARKSLNEMEMLKFEKSLAKKSCNEICNEGSPFCFAINSKMFSTYNQYIIREDSITDDIKPIHFNPYKNVKLRRRMRQLTVSLQRPFIFSDINKLTNINTDATEFRMTDGSDFNFKITDLKKVQQQPKETGRSYNKMNSIVVYSGRIEDKDSLNESILSISADDDSLSSINEEIMHRMTQEDFFQQRVTNTKIFYPNLFKDDTSQSKRINCVRAEHECDLKELEMRKLEYQVTFKNLFFEFSDNIFGDFIGPLISTAFFKRNNRPALNLNILEFNKLSKKIEKPQNKIKRTSIEIKTRKKHPSLNIKIEKRLFKNEKPRFSDKKPKKMFKSRHPSQNELTPNIIITNDVESDNSDDEFFRKFEKNKKKSINTLNNFDLN